MAESSAFPAGAAALLARPLRANPVYQLVLHDRLPPAERQWLAGVVRDPAHYGVLLPRAAGGGIRGGGVKLVDRDAALLFLTLEHAAGPLPDYVRSGLGDTAAAAVVAQLVADGVLQIEGPSGCFVSGAPALALIAPRPGSQPAAEAVGEAERGELPAAPVPGRLAELSRAALAYAQQLAEIEEAGGEPAGGPGAGERTGGADAGRLAHFLYGYHRLPLTPSWQRRLASPEAVRRFWGIDGGGAWRAPLDRGWQERPAAVSAGAPTWMHWRSRRAAAAADAAAVESPARVYKLYVSLAPAALPEAFGAVLDGLAAAVAPELKLGANAAAVLRPDKMVAYFWTFEDLALAADRLTDRLAGVAAHGVPFTAEICGEGVLSWGVDPPAWAGGTLQWEGRGSWRQWLTQRLAEALVGELARPCAMPAWRFAVERLRLEGVDTATWAPQERLWRRSMGAASG